jgi:cyclase
MLTRRIIPCLDVLGGRVVKGIRFRDLADAGDPAALAFEYMNEGADEIVFLDITASSERRGTMTDWVGIVADRLFIPFTVGGGISDVDQARRIVSLGADKISLNTAAVIRPGLISDCAVLLGSQAVVLAVDVKRKTGGGWEVFIKGGKTPADLDLVTWVKRGESLGCGEILLTSMDSDGTLGGFDEECIETVCGSVSIPVIASGGAGAPRHFLGAFAAGADAALAASVFHFGSIRIPDLKKYLGNAGIPVRIEDDAH